MKFPKEGDRDNEIAELLKKVKLPFLPDLTIFEMGTLIQMTFGNLF